MCKSQDKTFSDLYVNIDTNDTLIITYYHSTEEEYYFLQYEAEEEIYNDEISCKFSIWRRSYFSFLENRINGFKYEYC